eukprot:8759653-Pyramimonas_sp.AAC.1
MRPPSGWCQGRRRPSCRRKHGGCARAPLGQRSAVAPPPCLGSAPPQCPAALCRTSGPNTW